jgi:hypothetical protein
MQIMWGTGSFLSVSNSMRVCFYCRSFVNPISTVFEKMFCGQRSQESVAGPDVELGKPLPGSDSAEASRRR